MKKQLLILAVAAPLLGFSQWSKTKLSSQQKVSESHQELKSTHLYQLDVANLKTTLSTASERNTGKQAVTISLPTTSGKIEKFQVWEFSNMAPELQAKYPDIKSYVGVSEDNPSTYLRFSLSPQGLSSTLVRNGVSEYIEPYSSDRKVYVVYDSSERSSTKKDAFECTVHESDDASTGTVANKAVGSKIFRLALSGTGEYGVYHLNKAGTPATATDAEKKAVILAAMNATLTRLNSLYERDLSIHYNLIAQTESLIFYDPNTDPYSAGGGPLVGNNGINSILGSEATTLYDLGHLIDKKNANGSAYVGVLCGSSLKAGGWTAHNIPEGVTFDIDYVAHEMGHQMGAGHTYTMYTEQSDRTVEPGSGTTVMSYAGIVGNLDVQYNAQDNYHYSSIVQMKSKINSVTCGVNTPFANPTPNINAGADYTIPKTTPFKLRATTTDTNTSAYTYTFDQTDLAANAQIGTNSITYPDKPTGPNFRSMPQSTLPERHFPDFNKTLAGVTTTRWESLSSVSRALNFGVTVRNNHPTEPQIGQDAVKVTVTADAGPFVVTSPAFGASTSSGSAFNLTWNVAGTNAAPINTSTVNIKLSTDGGKTFTTLLANTANDGSESITIPANSTSSNAFFMIEAVGNIYYAVSPSFVIDYSTNGETCNTYKYTGSPVAITDGPGGSGISSPVTKVPLTITDNGVITQIKVRPNITHGNLTQLSFGIESPVGTQAVLMHHQCSARSGVTGTFTDEATSITCASPVAGNSKPFEPLALFKGHNAQGTWKLFASDNNAGTTGTIGAWELDVCTRNETALAVQNTNALADDIKLYPNPSKGTFFIKSRDIGDMDVQIYDMSGKKVHSAASKQSAGQNTQQYDVNLPKGVYLVTVKSSKGSYTQKLIIQ